MKTTNTMKHPSLSPLYFMERRNRFVVVDDASVSTMSFSSSSSTTLPSPLPADAALAVLSMWPSELWNKCLIEYSDWGDVARLSCVQSSWKSLLWDAAHNANGDNDAKWQCANAMMDGTHGLAKNVNMAMTLFQELAGPVDWTTWQEKYQQEEGADGAFDTTIMELSENNKNNDDGDDDVTKPDEHPYRAPAMRRMADFYLSGSSNASATSSLPATTTTINSPTSMGLAWLQATFDIGHDVTAAHDVAVLYEKGHPQGQIPIDVIASGRWFFKAARAGHVDSMAEVALLFELGIGGMVQSDEHALFWYRQAAMRGHTTSKYSVGEAWEEARGVPHSDVEEACLWYYKAALDGDEDGKLALQRLADVATRMRLVPLVVEQAPAGAVLDE